MAIAQQIITMNAPLIIQRLHFNEVIVPARNGSVNSDSLAKPLHMLPVDAEPSWSVQFDQLPKLILRMELSNGATALGEFYRDHDWARVDAVSASLLGKDIAKMCMQSLPIPLCREYDGFECAIWDAFAKALNVPLYVLLGGTVRNKVYVSAWSSHRTPEDAGYVAKNYQQQGYNCIKFKTDLEDDVVGWAEAIDRSAPGMKVVLDPNQRWENSASARRLLVGLEAVKNILLVEDPIPKWMTHEYGDLRRFTSIPVVQHVALPYVYQGQRVHDVINLIQNRAVDGFNFSAGLAKFKQMDAIASAANLFSFHGSEVDFGVLEAMYVHQAAAASSCVWPSDIFGRMIREHDLLRTPLEFSAPYVRVPEGAGLGVELDESAIQKYSQSEKVFE